MVPVEVADVKYIALLESVNPPPFVHPQFIKCLICINTINVPSGRVQILPDFRQPKSRFTAFPRGLY